MSIYSFTIAHAGQKRFGSDVTRATFEITTGDRSQTQHYYNSVAG